MQCLKLHPRLHEGKLNLGILLVAGCSRHEILGCGAQTISLIELRCSLSVVQWYCGILGLLLLLHWGCLVRMLPLMHNVASWLLGKLWRLLHHGRLLHRLLRLHKVLLLHWILLLLLRPQRWLLHRMLHWWWHLRLLGRQAHLLLHWSRQRLGLLHLRRWQRGLLRRLLLHGSLLLLDLLLLHLVLDDLKLSHHRRVMLSARRLRGN